MADVAYAEGHFESEKYFFKEKKELQEILTVKSDHIDYDNKYINPIMKKNSVSLHVRRHKFSEENNETKSKNNLDKSNIFTKELINYN